MLAVIKTTHSRNPWRLAWDGSPLADLHFRTRREAEAVARELRSIADFGMPEPEAWSPAVQERVAAYVNGLPCVQELERLRALDVERTRR